LILNLKYNSLTTVCKTQIHTKQIYFKERVTHLNYTWLHFATTAA